MDKSDNKKTEQDEYEKNLAWAAIICTTLSLIFNNYAPMIVFTLAYLDGFYKFDLKRNNDDIIVAINKLKKRYPNFTPAIDEEFAGILDN